MDTRGIPGKVGHRAPMVQGYGEEVMYAGWNPQLTLICESPVTQSDRHVNLLAQSASMDVDTFLRHVYENQR